MIKFTKTYSLSRNGYQTYKSTEKINVSLATLIISLILTASAVSTSFATPQPVRSYEEQLEQVRLYINNKMFEAALVELNKLKRTDKGSKDARLFTALAKVNYKLHYITSALNDLRMARLLSNHPKAKKRLTVLYEQWLNTFGLVRFESSQQLQRGTLNLTRTRKIINQDRAAALEHVQAEFSKGVTLPISVYLPYGSYSANGTTFKLKKDQMTPIVEVILTPLRQERPKPVQQDFSKWLYVGLGSAVLIGLSVGGYYALQDSPPASKTLSITINDGR